ncbi:MAG: class I tRNA ligase family protein [candidate division SR1 bacterium]|nr:class I tRNA ligase family protein [candidate division SR1 bacterium]
MSNAKNIPLSFDFKTVEKKWQDYWLTNHTYEAKDGDVTREKKYILVEFPFPSGASLHVGHVFRYTAPDIYSRFLRQKGYNVLFPMGWDAFGLPAEEYARKTGQNPRITTEQNIDGIKQNIQKMGYSIDWNREFSTTDPEYYKWTQWIFKKFYEQGLATQKDVELWYCKNLGTVLANEEVYDSLNGEKLSERGDHPVEKKKMKQWVLKMPEYAEKLLTGLENTHFPEHIKAMQRTWIGKSEGVTVNWDLVPRDYIKMVNNYPAFPYNTEFGVGEKDFTKIIRERSTAFIRIKGTDKYLSYIQNRYNDKNWVFLPGGGVDIGETSLQAAIRETKEELGLSGLEYVADLGSINAFGHWTGQAQHSTEHYFLLEVSMDNIKMRVKAEVDDEKDEMYGHVRAVTLEQYKANNWPQLNYIIENLEEYLTTGKIDRLEQHNREIVIGTTNKGKIDRWKHQLNITGVKLVSAGDLGLTVGEIVENGNSELENARIKAKAFWQMAQKPSISGDSGIYLEGVPVNEQPSQNTKRAAGVVETDDEAMIWQKMVDFYISRVEKYGINGELNAYFLDVFSLYDGFNFYDVEVKRSIIITNQITYPDRKVFPLCNIYKVPKNGKYYYDLSSEEMDDFLIEYKEARNLLSSYLFDGEDASGHSSIVQTYTTRVDTLPSATFVVVAPEYSGLLELSSDEYKLSVATYIEQTKAKSERERQINKEKTGVFTGRFVTNPLTNELCPVWVTDFVLGSYGTGAVMGDAHDLRDAELALKYDIYLNENISKDGEKREDFVELLKAGEVFIEDGILYNSGEFSALNSDEAREKIAEKLLEIGKGMTKTNYRMRDFVFSRQRYWGEPFPFEYTNNGEIKVISDDKLPLVLPDLEDFEPSKDGRSPLAKSDWINIRDEQGSIVATHEADTMPNWAGSSWYYLRFTDPKNDEEFASEENLKYWLPVDHYFGGSEHTTLHLLYSRFWHKFLYDMGKVPTPEPYDYRTNGGILLGPDGSKMSKSKGNVIQPDDKLDSVGADALRIYIAFIGPYDATVIWQDGGLKACKTLVDRIWNLQSRVSFTSKNDLANNKKLYIAYNKFVKSVSNLLEEMKNNVAVAEIMTFTNLIRETPTIPLDIYEGFIKVVAPFAPHLCEELWSVLGNKTSIALSKWPTFDPELCIDNVVRYAVQVNGKVRADFEIEANVADVQVLEAAKLSVEKYLEGKTIKFSKIIPRKLVTLVVN